MRDAELLYECCVPVHSGIWLKVRVSSCDGTIGTCARAANAEVRVGEREIAIGIHFLLTYLRTN